METVKEWREESDKEEGVERVKGEIKWSQGQGNRRKRVIEKDKEAEQESNHLTGLKVSVRLSYTPEAKTMQEFALDASSGMKDEPSSSKKARDRKTVWSGQRGTGM